MADTIVHRLRQQAKRRGDAPAYLVKKSGVWHATSWREYGDEIERAARAMIHLGLTPGQKTCILGFNRPEWVVFDVATMMAGGAPAGIYTTCSPEEVAYILNHSEAPLALLENEEQWKKVKEKRSELPHLKKVVMMKGASVDDPLVLSWDAFLALGKGAEREKELESRVEALKDDDVATLIYTSGTTGPPKAVMLSHKNLAWTARILAQTTGMEPGGRGLSYLPLSHIAEQMASIHGPITVGGCVYYAESIEKIADNLKDCRPTLFFGVPRIWEKFHAAIGGKLEGATGAKKALLGWARGVATRAIEVKNRGDEPSGALAVQYALAKKLVFKKLHAAVGLDQATTLISGAAPISKEVIEFFSTLDLIVQEVYGQSEGSGPTTLNLLGRTRFGSVGPALPGVDVKIAEDGEILVKGPNVFLGYYKDQAATDECLKDGWLHSGDLGRIDDEGYLHITGRKKDILITAGGKNITPKNIESGIKNNPLVHEAVVIGDRRKFLTAVISPNLEAAEKFMKDRGLSGPVHTCKEIHDAIWETVEKDVNTKLARVEQVKKIKVLERPLSVEDGELTPTLKVKRAKVNEHFAKDIESMYVE
jgi:long-chain acyl-CoA synthetase